MSTYVCCIEIKYQRHIFWVLQFVVAVLLSKQIISLEVERHTELPKFCMFIYYIYVSLCVSILYVYSSHDLLVVRSCHHHKSNAFETLSLCFVLPSMPTLTAVKMEKKCQPKCGQSCFIYFFQSSTSDIFLKIQTCRSKLCLLWQVSQWIFFGNLVFVYYFQLQLHFMVTAINCHTLL